MIIGARISCKFYPSSVVNLKYTDFYSVVNNGTKFKSVIILELYKKGHPYSPWQSLSPLNLRLN